MNPFDVAAIAVLVLSLWAGFRSGAFPQVGGLVGAGLGGGAAILWGVPLGQELLAGAEPLWRAFVILAGLLAAVAVGEGLGSAAGHLVSAALGQGLLGALDRLAGALVGIGQGVFIVWLIGGLLAVGPFPRLASLAQTSVVVRLIGEEVPPPTAFVGDLAHLLDVTGLPDVFVGLEPLPAPPVDLPSSADAQRIAALAEASTVRLASVACRAELTGSGFAVAPGYVVTNAHVVAGARTTRIRQGGSVYDARVVLFDPELDVAVVYAPALRAPALSFAPHDPGRGTVGAALGYPEGGPLTVVPAAVSASLLAQGRDIYDRQLVTRPILELRAAIEPGDSGGPLVLADGEVGGVVFAKSRTDPDVGFALTPTSVAARVASGIGRTAAVDTGPCID
jgi:S1-C subfamily serine protease